MNDKDGNLDRYVEQRAAIEQQRIVVRQSLTLITEIIAALLIVFVGAVAQLTVSNFAGLNYLTTGLVMAGFMLLLIGVITLVRRFSKPPAKVIFLGNSVQMAYLNALDQSSLNPELNKVG